MPLFAHVHYTDQALRVLMKYHELTQEEYEIAAQEYKKEKASAAGSQPPEAPYTKQEEHINQLLDTYMKKLNLGQFEVSLNALHGVS